MLCVLATLSVAEAKSAQQQQIPEAVQIAEDSGGEIIHYLLKQSEFRENNTPLQFTGRCDSACTLFLGLPPSQLCLTKTAYFRFHLPIAEDEKMVQKAARILLRKYPAWVNAWIEDNHGLSSDLMTMDYAYARRFLKPCSSAAKTSI